MYRIAITGGPCGGKSKSLDTIAEKLSDRGYKVIIVPEAATKLILSGIIPGETISVLKFQEYVLSEQLHNEQLAENAAKLYDKKFKDVVLLCDRGLADQMAYISKKQFEELLKKQSIIENKSNRQILNITEVYARYDCVIHMVTAADGAEEFYEWAGSETCQNPARSEPPELAIKKDTLTQCAWMGCNHYRIIDNSTDFNTKVHRALIEVFHAIGEPVPLEIERKFLLPMPEVENLREHPYYITGTITKSEIVQTYLKQTKPFVERRIRQRGTKEDGYSFYYTEKTLVARGTWEEKEKRISMEEYIHLLTEADPNLHQINKTRYCFLHRKHYFELDIYAFCKDYAILEVEVNDIDEQVGLPMMSAIKEVTGDDRYKNHSIAKDLCLKNFDA